MNSALVLKLKKQLEQKNRELSVESSLERVRIVAMAMKKPQDMLDVCRVISKELEKLGIKEIRNIQTAIVNEEKAVYLNYEYFRLQEKTFVTAIAYKPHKATHAFVRKMLKDPEGFFTKNFNGRTEIGDWIKYQAISGQYVDPHLKKAKSLHYYFYSIGPGALGISTYAPLNKKDIDLFKRFRNVFRLSYQRFVDIQKAEAQARESQIEAALERVRGKALAMHKSEELHGVVTSLKKELMGLNIPTVIAATIYLEQDDGSIRVVDLTTGGAEDADNHLKLDKVFRMEDTDPKLWVWRLFNASEKYFVEEVDEEDFKRVVRWLDTVDPAEARIAEKIIRENKIKKAWLPTVRLEKGRMNIDLLEPPTPEIEHIMLKLGAGFDLAYRRFLDLQKAETQARESQIQLALERVRARTLAMQKSDELLETSEVLYQQLEKLGQPAEQFTIGIINEVQRVFEISATFHGKQLAHRVHSSIDEPYMMSKTYHGWKERLKSLVVELRGKDLGAYNRYRNKLVGEKKFPTRIHPNESWVAHLAYFSHGMISLSSKTRLPHESLQLLERFASVFDLTYTRFLDLKNAEAQAKDARIEAALERVRSRTMAMHKSEEVMDVAGTLFEELQKLDFTFGASSIIIMDKDSGDAEYWIAGFTKNKFPESYPVKYFRHPYHDALLTAWKNGKKSLVYTLEGKEKKAYDKVLFSETGYRNIPEVEKELMRGNPSVTFSIAFMKHGALHWGPSALSEDQANVLQRFAQVFEQAYTRFNDLKQAEAQTREANIEVALERVRARALAMQQPEELIEVAQVLRIEMGLLGVEELETASIYIHDKDAGTADCWYALKDPAISSKKMVTDQFHLDLEDTWVGKEMKKFYLSGEKQTSIQMQGSRRKEWVEYCYKHSPAFSGFYGENIPDRTYHLYKFSHGYLGAAAPGDISAESWKLLSRAASVFSLAYSRFKDLTQARYDLRRLKEEKQRAESALAELKSTQTQLIQSEKMASLGELTAGIAHEIQNPLNFVNNFSELSNELIAEMKDELVKGNKNDAMQIVENVQQNLEKINFHGKRADAIVKSMLQHSRSSSGQKEFTDINELAGEYLRLAYHGFRVKDPSFNAKFETHLDERLEKINVVPQEIGRVMLNLINNAFYAVSEKKKETGPGYEPLVIISTQKNNGNIEIKVKDNGHGIQPQVIEKIFQPFFTTKPAGQGTGLGLSLSYDIIKGHGGELEVNTKEGEGSEFTIRLLATARTQ